ncbi:two-component system sensor histidine kinase NtrB [Cellvibrio sp.]|uniref:two-component system sensor histidine kinase NtrB n=1 Tax=Cellvibrio sp. TaxID=1965322 RepID=UPI0039648947
MYSDPLMKKWFAALVLCSLSIHTYADIFWRFRNPDGTTKWQWVANFSSSVLILTLLIVMIFLILANRRAGRANRELTDIKSTLEDRVARRTASLIETTEALKSREQYITSIVESMPLMLIGLNQNMEVIQWNRVAESSTGRPIASVLGKKLWDAYPAITLTPEQVSEVLQTRKTMTIKHSQRDQYYFDITVYALTDKGETGVVILVDDITKQMKAENKVSERDKMSAMGELASAMAYDINLPLQSILSSLDDAQAKLSNADILATKSELLATLKNARFSGKQASAIIQNLLDLASSHHDDKSPADITRLMDESISLADTLFTDLSGLRFSDIKITRHYHDGLPQIPCYYSELQQVFVRLLRNAFHSLNNLEQANPAINVEISEFYDSLWIKIQHNGRPLTPLEQEDIFQPFFSISEREPACPVEQRLSYSYFIITDHHRGQMSVTSDEKFGTCFNIQLPLV